MTATAQVAAPAIRGRQSIGGAAVILLGGFVASRLLGLLRDVLVGARFGTTPDYDLYVAAFKIPDAIFTLVAGGALGSVLVPVFSEFLTGPGDSAAPSSVLRPPSSPAARLSRLASSVLNLLALVAGLAAILGIVFAPRLVPLFGGFSPEQQARLAVLVRVLLLQPVFFGVAEVLTRFLNAHHHFTYPASGTWTRK